MSKLTDIDFLQSFKSDADSIRIAREKAQSYHKSNIRAAGNEVEEVFRHFIKSRIPGRYRIGQGHLINTDHKVTPQIDLLITDNHSLPVMIEASDHTEYFSCESVYVIGEVKSTYYSKDKPFDKFCDTIRIVKDEMGRFTVPNTCINGQASRKSAIIHMLYSSPNDTINPLLSIMFFANKGDFQKIHFQDIIATYEAAYLPNLIVILDYGFIFQTQMIDKGMAFNIYPEYNKDNVKWILFELDNDDSNSGLAMVFLYYYLVAHLTHCHLNTPDYYSYLKKSFMLNINSVTEL